MSSARGMTKSSFRHSSRRWDTSLGKNMDTHFLMYISIAAVMMTMVPAIGYEVLDGQDSFRTRPLPKIQNHSQRSNMGHSSKTHDIGNPVDPDYEYYDEDSDRVAAIGRDFEYDYEKHPETRNIPKEQTVYEKSKHHDYYSKYDDYYPTRQKTVKPTTQQDYPSTTSYMEEQTNPTQKPTTVKVKTSRQQHQKEYQSKQMINNSRHQEGDKPEQGRQQIRSSKTPSYRKKRQQRKTNNDSKGKNDRQQQEYRSYTSPSAASPTDDERTKPYYVPFREYPERQQQNHRQQQEPLPDHELQQPNLRDHHQHQQQQQQQQHRKQLQQKQERDHYLDRHYEQQQQQQKSHQQQQQKNHQQQQQQKSHQQQQQKNHHQQQQQQKSHHQQQQQQKSHHQQQQQEKSHHHKQKSNQGQKNQEPLQQSLPQRKEEELPQHFQTAISAAESVHERTSTSEDQVAAATGYRGNTRAQFHEQGIHGPHSYKFGYNTGDSFNPMARYEERDADGFVRGSYSFVDALGKHQVVYYESHPKFGFRTRGSPGSHSHSGF